MVCRMQMLLFAYVNMQMCRPRSRWQVAGSRKVWERKLKETQEFRGLGAEQRARQAGAGGPGNEAGRGS